MNPDKKPQNKPIKTTPIPHEQKSGMVLAEHYEGLIPHPRLMKEWEALVPGSAESIFKRFEEQSDHRLSSESKVIRAHNFKLYVSPVFAFIIAIGAIGGGVLIALNSAPYVGGFISFSGLATVIAPFLVSEYKQDKKKDGE